MFICSRGFLRQQRDSGSSHQTRGHWQQFGLSDLYGRRYDEQIQSAVADFLRNSILTTFREKEKDNNNKTFFSLSNKGFFHYQSFLPGTS